MTDNSDAKPTEITVHPSNNKGPIPKNAKVDDTAPTVVKGGLKAAPKSNSPAEPFDVPESTRIISDNEIECTTGWLVIIDGPGKGKSLPIGFGNNLVGRSNQQQIPLNFGDNSISKKHAAIIFDDKNCNFYLAREEAKNNIYLNDDLVIESKKLLKGDRLNFGKTTLLFVPLCDDKFTWNEDS